MNRQNSQIVCVWISVLVILVTAGFLATIPGQHTPVVQQDQNADETLSLRVSDDMSEASDVVIVTADHLEYVATVDNPQKTTQVKPAKAQGQILAYVKGRDLVVGIYSGQRFDVRDLAGNLVAANLNVMQFQKRYPQLYENYRTSFAEAWAGMDQLGGLEVPAIR